MNKINQQYLQDWETRVHAKRQLQESSVLYYRDNIRLFIEWCELNKIDLVQVTWQVIDQYATDLQAKGVKPNSIHIYLQSIKHFYRYLANYLELLPYNPVYRYLDKGEAPTRQRSKSHPRADLNDVRRLVLDSPEAKVKIAAALFLEGGLRPNELLRIEVEHINLSDQPKEISIDEEKIVIHPWCVYIRYGKGRGEPQPRQIILIGPIRAMLKTYLRRRSFEPRQGPQLILNQYGRQMTDTGLMKRFYDSCELLQIRSGAGKGYQQRGQPKVGVGAIYPRQIRPLFASEMNRRRMNEAIIRAQLGHVGMTTMERVYIQPSYEERLEEHQRVGCLLV